MNSTKLFLKMKSLVPFAGICALLFLITGAAVSETPGKITNAGKIHNQGFVENKGQIRDQYKQANSDVKYLYCSPGFNLQLRTHGFSYDTYREVPAEIANTTQPQNPRIKIKLPVPPPVCNYHR